MKKPIWLMLIIALNLLWCPLSHAQVTNIDRAIFKLQVMSESGVEYRDYSNAVIDGLLELKIFEQTIGGDVKKKAKYQYYMAVLSDYQKAKEIWNFAIETFNHVSLGTIHDLIKPLEARYPGIEKAKDVNGCDEFRRSALSAIWGAASQKIKAEGGK